MERGLFDYIEEQDQFYRETIRNLVTMNNETTTNITMWLVIVTVVFVIIVIVMSCSMNAPKYISRPIIRPSRPINNPNNNPILIRDETNYDDNSYDSSSLSPSSSVLY